jgi:hypothetical protein
MNTIKKEKRHIPFLFYCGREDAHGKASYLIFISFFYIKDPFGFRKKF